MRHRRWVCVLVVVSAVWLPSTAVRAARGDPDPGFGGDGVVAIASAFGAIQQAAASDDSFGRIVLATLQTGTGQIAVADVRRLLPNGTVDAAFGVGGQARIALPKYGASLNGVETLPDGSVAVAFGNDVANGDRHLIVLSADGRQQRVVPVDAPPGVGVNDLVAMTDGRVALATGGAHGIQMLLPNGALDAAYGGRLDALTALGFTELVVTSIARQSTSGLLAVVQFTQSGTRKCQLYSLLDKGVLVPVPLGAQSLPGQYDRCGAIVAEPRGYRWNGNHIDHAGAVVGPAPVRTAQYGPLVDNRRPAPTSFDGTGREYWIDNDYIWARYPDGSVDEGFGESGARPLSEHSDPLAIVMLRSGGVLAVSGSVALAEGGYQQVDLEVFTETFGAAPQPPIISSSAFVPLTPTRIVDTRNIADGVPLPAGSTIQVRVVGERGVPVSATAVVINLTTTGSNAPGYATAFPNGEPVPNASSINLDAAGQTRANLVTVPIGTDGSIAIFTLASAHLIADLQGYFVPEVASPDGRFTAVSPARLLDTRTAAPRLSRTLDLAATGVAGVPASGVEAVVLNLTVTDPVGAGFGAAWPGGTPQPLVSNVNFSAGETRANLVIVPVGPNGTISLATSVDAQLVVDIAGWFTDATNPVSSSGLFVPVGPARVLDTRLGGAPDVRAGGTIAALSSGSAVIPAAPAVPCSPTSPRPPHEPPATSQCGRRAL